MKIWLLLVGIFATASFATAAESQNFSRYQIIIDRSPFGPVTAGAAAATPDWAQRFQLVALVMSNSGTGPLQAIIFDQEANRSYFKAQGESIEGGAKIVRIETDPPKIVMQHQLLTAQLSFQPRANVPAPPVTPNVGALRAPGANPNAPPSPTAVRRIPFRRGN